MDNHDTSLQHALSQAREALLQMGFWDDDLQKDYDNSEPGYIMRLLENCKAELANAKRQLIAADYWDDELQEAYINNDYDYIMLVLDEYKEEQRSIEEMDALLESLDNLSEDEQDSYDESEEFEEHDPPQMSFWEKLRSAFVSTVSVSGEVLGEVIRRSNHPERRCNGDCNNCPSHYGYCYGRWYYGHGHQHGCERGGNGGASMRTFRN